ncbi:hypothetical protein IV203_033731 [Nitzschia inconspicua]|uniref:Uncharacterized protein n=1 Tax=Nitzschia inconspicua TaxID=303405 RepID=A0A9K3M2Z9_9STRA|nr:hypothetical protein IV203_033731 [Nitzschia inconspicua]
MFLPTAVEENKRKEADRKAAFKNIEGWCLQIIPETIRNDAQVSIQEVQCGDPMCAPIDTAVTIQFSSGCNGIFGLPMEAKDVTLDDLKDNFPTIEVLEKWYAGEDADWPPIDEEPDFPELRFSVGTRVLCRIGPDANKDWAPGTIVLLWYREPNWPKGSFAPYKIELDDGRSIFAPGDMDQVIRLHPSSVAENE